MDKWEQEIFDKQSAAEVALELHMARMNYEKEQTAASVLHTEAARLKRLWEAAEQKSENAGYDVQMASERVRQLELYLNKRVGA